MLVARCDVQSFRSGGSNFLAKVTYIGGQDSQGRQDTVRFS